MKCETYFSFQNHCIMPKTLASDKMNDAAVNEAGTQVVSKFCNRETVRLDEVVKFLTLDTRYYFVKKVLQTLAEQGKIVRVLEEDRTTCEIPI